jgi:hypothetical protein
VTHRYIQGESAVFRLSLGESRVNGVRSKEERLVSLMGRDGRVDEIAHALSALPMTWPALRQAYETVVGIKQGDRADYKNLANKGWFTLAESNRFYHAATFHSHGHPRSPITKTSAPMPYEEACAFIERLFWRLVDDMEPT